MKTKCFGLAILVLLPLAAAAQTADEVVNKALAVRGGVEKIKEVQSERVTGRISFTGGLEGTFVLELKRFHKMRIEISVEGKKSDSRLRRQIRRLDAQSLCGK
jgi:hypothetical protein